ncbi:hypothetical protein N7499_002528 [Penicillium canescens]|uniref:Uncharacterized protein n=1 Tax=Penicillium canescens TaxID=5083 RepID=A0AAD6I7N0_PENCN|nr:uncharacterized protein N7446_010130 [Penicillium canescens]KAJ6001569.1 hypothetical protein N7522_006796 [Penicillium canescens]KAJ6035371.1 hypothetical protein N7460_009546 [Penicillium canescens]KAJ6037498.1 hypothetical protein N7444_010203 [Penicillium canescens]KAJ6054118.1 hypothetical protein N7446_010130 [Penicillium canescens]KAJ6098154.1 hypothetical protein N7499_002528 [Penicillium canescens]
MEGTSADATVPLKHNGGFIVPSTEEDVDRVTKETPLQRTFNNYWGWEILAYVTSLVALIILIVVLQKYNGKGIPDWPFGITINSILSWITQILTACMLAVVGACVSQSKLLYFNESDRPLADVNIYDSASRGPLGSFVFLAERRLGLRNLAAIGAVVTILSIGVGPLVQQMASVDNVRVKSDIPASVPRTKAFTDEDNSQDLPTSGLLSSIYTSLYGASNFSTNLNSVMPDCPTGNCDFSPFRSLAVCSHCINITDLLSFSVSNSTCRLRYPRVNHTLPNGVHAQVGGGYSDHALGPITAGEAYNNEALSAPEALGSSSFVNFTAISIANNSVLNHASAIQCSLLWCVNTYEIHMENNKAHETLVESYHDPKAWFNNSMLELRPPTKGNLTASLFAVSQTTSNYISYWFSDKLLMNNSYSASDTSFCSGEKGSTDQFTTEFSQPMQESGITAVFSQIAAGMTSYIRKKNLAALKFDRDLNILKSYSGEHVHGISWMIQTQIRVRWEWIIFPVVLLTLTSIFFVTTVLKSKTQKLGVWKSSSIPLLCSGLDQNVQRNLLESGSPDLADKLANNVQVRLLDWDATEYPE